MQKVLIEQKTLKEIRSGAARIVLSQIELFKSMGYEVHLVAEAFNKQIIESYGAKLHKTFKWPINGYMRRNFYDKSVSRLAAGQRPDLLIGHGNIIKQDICFFHNCVHLAHELIYEKPLPTRNDVGRLHAQILKSRCFKILVCNSELMKRDLVSRFGVENRQVEVIYPSFDKRLFSCPNAHLRKNLGINQSTCIVGLVTSGDYKKRNVDFFLNAVAEFSGEKDIHIVIAGGKPSEHHKKIAEKISVPVSFLPSTDYVSDYYNLIDVFVLPAHIEEFGLSVLEAMYFGKPVVVYNMVGAAEILEGESREFILSCLDKKVFMDRLAILIQDSGLRHRLGKLNRETALKYEVSSQDKQLIRLLDQIVT